MTDVTHALLAEITKWEADPEDDAAVIVYGKATSGDLDLDQQIVDPSFAKKAMADWFSDYANLRQMHSTNLPPAGKGIELESRPDGEYVKARVIEPGAVKLVKGGAYAAFSVGINNARVIRDNVAKNGRIVDGRVVELSLVDRPANPTCKLLVAKGEGEAIEFVGKAVDVDVAKKDYSDDERSSMADSGEALPDGSFPIKTKADLQNAISSYGRSKDPQAAKQHIIERAKALGATDELPADWSGSTKPKDEGKTDGKQANYVTKRLHDMLCAAYSWDAVKAAYPVIKDGVASALGGLGMTTIYQMLAEEVQEDGGSGSESDDILSIATAYDSLCDFLQAEAMEDYDLLAYSARSDLNKLFREANGLTVEKLGPDVAKSLPSPSSPPSPGQFKRPYIAAGHAQPVATSQHNVRIPSGSGNVNAGQFDRGLITAGHEANSPGNKADGETDVAKRDFYTNAAKDNMQSSLQAIHDAVASIFPDTCPMGPGEENDLDTNAGGKPEGKSVPDTTPAPGEEDGMKAADADVTKAAAMPDIASLVEEAVTKALEKAALATNEKITALEAEVEKLAREPDPNQAPFRGAWSRKGPAQTVSKAESVAEAQKRAKDEAQAEYVAHLRKVAASGDPGMRELAVAELTKLGD